MALPREKTPGAARCAPWPRASVAASDGGVAISLAERYSGHRYGGVPPLG